MRKNVSLNLTKLNPKDYITINTWLDHQKNNQESILNAILHVINQTGAENDVTSFESQRKLFTKSNANDVNTDYGKIVDTLKTPATDKKSTNKEAKKENNEVIDMTSFGLDDF